MVCFVGGKPKKTEYRKYDIKDVIGPNDFAMMREVVGRRYRRIIDEDAPLPDLVVIDGGKGQLSAAKSALDALGLGYVPVIGLAKRLEEVFKPGMSEPQNISKTSAGLHLLRKIRDEVHRYAITFHRKKRSQHFTRSALENIPGIGQKTAISLLREFGSIEAIKKASLDDVEKVIGYKKAQLIQAGLE